MNKVKLNVGERKEIKKPTANTEVMKKPEQRKACLLRFSLVQRNPNYENEAREKINAIKDKFQDYVSSTEDGRTAGLKDWIEPQEIMKWVNVYRTTPKNFIPLIQDRMNRTDGDNMVSWGKNKQKCIEGRPAYKEAIRYIQKYFKPVLALELNRCLCLAASDLVRDSIANDLNGYTGSDGCETQERYSRRIGLAGLKVVECVSFVSSIQGPDFAKQAVLSLVIDEEFKDRARRNVLTIGNYAYFGAAMFKDPNKGYRCVIALSNQDFKPLIDDGEDENPVYGKKFGSQSPKKPRIPQKIENNLNPEEKEKPKEKPNDKDRQRKPQRPRIEQEDDETKNEQKPQQGPKEQQTNQEETNPSIKQEASPESKRYCKKLREKFESFLKSKPQQHYTESFEDVVVPEKIIKWVNLARTKPKQFAEHIKKQLACFVDNKDKKKGGQLLSSIEGKSAVQEAIKFLEKQKPLPALETNECLNWIAGDHAMDMVMNNHFNHVGSDGSDLQVRARRRCGKLDYVGIGENIDQVMIYQAPDFALATVIRYIVDDGVDSRGHRANIFHPEFKTIGAYMIKDPGVNKTFKFAYWGVINFSYINLPLANREGGVKNLKYLKSQQMGQSNQYVDNALQEEERDHGRKPQTKKEASAEHKRHVRQIREKFDSLLSSNPQKRYTEDFEDVIASQRIIKWLNLARTKPQQFVEYIKKQTALFIDDKRKMKAGLQISTMEGKSSHLEAIRFLEKQKPLPAFEANQCLTWTAGDHAMDMLVDNFFDHVSSDGSDLQTRARRRCGNLEYVGCAENCDRITIYEAPDFALATVVRYIIDDGVPSRGHRTNIFNPEIKFVGACMIKDPGVDGSTKMAYRGVVNFSLIYLPLVNKEGGIKNLKYLKSQKQQQPEGYHNNSSHFTGGSPGQGHNFMSSPYKMEARYKIDNDAFKQMTIQEDSEFQKMWQDVNSRLGPTSSKNMFDEGAFSTPSKASVVSQKISTKTVVVNGMKKTEITKTIEYSDGSIQKTITKV